MVYVRLVRTDVDTWVDNAWALRDSRKVRREYVSCEVRVCKDDVRLSYVRLYQS
jgi:hypothetical protein